VSAVEEERIKGTKNDILHILFYFYQHRFIRLKMIYYTFSQLNDKCLLNLRKFHVKIKTSFNRACLNFIARVKHCKSFNFRLFKIKLLNEEETQILLAHVTDKQ
jgi:hypothetical protein